MNSGAPDGWAVSVPLMAPVVLIYCFTYFARDDKDGMKDKMLFSHSHHLITVSKKKVPLNKTHQIYSTTKNGKNHFFKLII